MNLLKLTVLTFLFACCSVACANGNNANNSQLGQSGSDSAQQSTNQSSNSGMVGGSGSLPPAYLSVKNFKQCLGTQQHDTWTSWCLPKKQPNACPNKSWKQLQGQSIPACQK